MKKTLIALAVLAASGGSFAQSTVTIDGRVDINVTRVSARTASLTTVGRNGVGSSRVAFKGVEDLGGGLTAKFTIDTDLAADAPAGVRRCGAGGRTAGVAARTNQYRTALRRRPPEKRLL